MKKVRPFSNGTEYEMWNERNCDECNLSADANKKSTCHIEQSLLCAYFDDGKIDKKIFDKIGKRKDLHLNSCPFKNAYVVKPIKLNLTVFKHQQLNIF